MHAGEDDAEAVHGGCGEVPEVCHGQGAKIRRAGHHHGQQGDQVL